LTQYQIRRLVVTDTDGRLAGVLSLSDLGRAAARDAAVGKEALRVLTGVCQRKPAPATAAGPVADALPRTARLGQMG
jgi:CBS-domain-containing membrane protein